MLLSNNERQWGLVFFARLFTTLGTPPLLFGYWSAIKLPADMSDPAFVASKFELVLCIEAVAGVFILCALLFDLLRTRSYEVPGWINRVMCDLPLFSLYPHPLRWILGTELLFWVLVMVQSGILILHSLMK
jgi:hypothetical protein